MMRWMRIVPCVGMLFLVSCASGGPDGGQGMHGPTPRERVVSIVLVMKAQGSGKVCGFEVPDARGYRKEIVHFEISNYCDSEQTVSLRFPSARTPFTNDRYDSRPIKPGDRKTRIAPPPHVKDDADYGDYSYDIYLNNVKAADPKFEVDPWS